MSSMGGEIRAVECVYSAPVRVEKSLRLPPLVRLFHEVHEGLEIPSLGRALFDQPGKLRNLAKWMGRWGERAAAQRLGRFGGEHALLEPAGRFGERSGQVRSPHRLHRAVLPAVGWIVP
jgi:hypothetical protein